MRDTIFALSSGLPPAGLAVIRISGTGARIALNRMAGRLPKPKVATLARLFASNGEMLDHSLILWFPGPKSVTGEDVAELHLHGGRAVVAAVLSQLSAIDGFRGAERGEFTRRAFENQRIDLGEAEGLSDLLAAETESQRRSAMLLAQGALGTLAARWNSWLLAVSAQVEAMLDFSDEDDVSDQSTESIATQIAELSDEIAHHLARPTAEKIKDGVSIVLAGPPNSGKSTLFNALIGREAAIVSDIAGTTRDRIEAPMSLAGNPVVFVDTAGLRENSEDIIERIGIERTASSIASCDILLWLGPPSQCPPHQRALLVAAKSDIMRDDRREGIHVSALTGAGVDALSRAIDRQVIEILPRDGELALNARHREILRDLRARLANVRAQSDPLLIAEGLRTARMKLDQLTGRAGVEDMLDALFGNFCIGK